MARRRSGAAVLLITCAAVSGCASSAGGAGGATSSGASGGSVASRTVHLGAADNGGRITVANGSTIVLTLENTYWHLAPVSSTVLQAGRVAVHPGKSHIPGSGSGIVVAIFRATRPGRTVVAADRTSCGEAMACSPAQSRYRVTVVVR